MQRQEFMTAGRVAGRSVERLWGEARLPTGERSMVEFSQEVIWVEATESVVTFLHGGQEVETFGTFTDFYGYGTSACGKSGAIRKAKEVAEHFRVNAESSAQVVVTQTTYQEPALEAQSQEAREVNAKADRDPKYKRRFAHVPESWRTRREEMTESGDTQTWYPQLERKVVKQEVVWSVGCGVAVLATREAEEQTQC